MKSCLLCAGLGWNSSSNFPVWVDSLTDCLIVVLCPQGSDSLVTLCRYPFVFDAQAKTTLLQTDAVLQMQVRVNHLTVLLVSFSVTTFSEQDFCRCIQYCPVLLIDGSGPSTDAELKLFVHASGISQPVPHSHRTQG